jgi:hypothetical protein
LVLCKNALDDFLSNRFRRGKKQIVNDCFVAVFHRQRFGHELEASDLVQSISEGINDGSVGLFFKIRGGE